MPKTERSKRVAQLVTVNMEKSFFAKEEVDVCGHQLSYVGIAPTAATVEAMRAGPRQSCSQELG